MTVRELTTLDSAVIDQLVNHYPFKPYRNYRLLSRQRQSEVLRAEIGGWLQVAGSFGVAAGEGDTLAVALGRPLAWDSAFFGTTMGRLDYVLRAASAERQTIRGAVIAALQRFRDLGVQHVTMKLDVADGDTLTVAEDEGFRLMDALVTYVAHPKRSAPRRVKHVGAVRRFRPEDEPEVLEITREAYKGFRGRFQIDPHLPRERSDEFYVEWARKCCSGAMADRILVADGGQGQLYGWASVKRAEPVSSVGGAIVSSGSLGACRPDRLGAYAGLIGTIAAENHAAGILTEAQTQNSNFAMVRVLEAVGAQYARAEYTFHRWLG